MTSDWIPPEHEERWERDGRRVAFVSEDGTVRVAVELMRQMFTDLGFTRVESNGRDSGAA